MWISISPSLCTYLLVLPFNFSVQLLISSCIYAMQPLCACHQRPAKTTARLWRCPNTPRTWGSYWGCAPEASSSSSSCWAPSSSSSRKGKSPLITVERNFASSCKTFGVTPHLLSFFSETVQCHISHLPNFRKGHGCSEKIREPESELHCFQSRMANQRDQTTLICRAYLRVKYLIKGGCNSISHLITHAEQRPDP